jgi:hypothetical protein
MAQKPLPDFQTWQERDDYFRDHADYFTLVKKDGVGYYSRDEAKTLAELEKLAQTKIAVGGGRYLVYAVIGEQSALVKTIR